MKKVVIGVLAVVVCGVAGAAAAVFTGQNSTVLAAHGNRAVAQAQQETQDNEQAATVYHYEAQPGDSYTLMARKAVQTYGKKHNVKLSLAGIIYAETQLTRDADSPVLGVGQEVEFDEQTVKQWVDKAQNLSDEAEAAWSYYVQFANFNTDNVGESR